MNKCTHPMAVRHYSVNCDAVMCDACGEIVEDRWSVKPTPGKALDPSAPMPMEQAQLDGMNVVEGNIMDVTQRIKYNDKEGHWEVLFNGKVIKQAFKTSSEAYQHLDELRRKVKEPKY